MVKTLAPKIYNQYDNHAPLNPVAPVTRLFYFIKF